MLLGGCGARAELGLDPTQFPRARPARCRRATRRSVSVSRFRRADRVRRFTSARVKPDTASLPPGPRLGGSPIRGHLLDALVAVLFSDVGF
jgi:hypothetical protein